MAAQLAASQEGLNSISKKTEKTKDFELNSISIP
jgi:hypothetical protein